MSLATVFVAELQKPGRLSDTAVMALSVRPAGGTASTRPLGSLTFSRAPAPREPGGAAVDVSLSDLARATGALPSTRDAAPATPAEMAERSARAEMARTLATLSEPARALASFSRAELTRGTALLRARVLRGGLTPARELGPAPMNDLAGGLGGLAPSQRYASSLRSESTVPEQTDPSWSAFVLLTRSDRTLLSLLYVSAQTEGADLQRVDDVTRALLVLRQREQTVRTPEAERGASAIRFSAPRLPGDLGVSSARAVSEPPSQAEPESERVSQAPSPSSSDSFTSLNFGNAAGFAARAVSSYRSLLPPASAAPSVPPKSAPDGATSAAQALADQSASSAALTRSFSAAQALGVSSLIDSLTRNLQTSRRPTRKRKPREREPHATTREQDADREARRRARWHALFRRRRALRRAAAR